MSVGDILSLVAIAFGLSADCFAVSISSGLSGKHSNFSIFRVALSFALFQAFMPVIGWFAGRSLVQFVGQYDHWVAFGLLAAVGGHMIWESIHEKDGDKPKTDFTQGWALILVSFATSIDALAVGLSFALLKINIGLASLIIGTVCFAVTLSGFVIGRKSSQFFGKYAEIAGGIILIGIGTRILISHIS